MKKLLTLLAISIIAASCSDDDNNSTNLNSRDSIVGTWKLTAIYNGTTLEVVSECMSNNVIKLDIDNTSVQTVALGGGSECSIISYNGNYVVEGSTLTIANAYMHPDYEIIELTNSKLHLSPVDGNATSMEYTRQ